MDFSLKHAIVTGAANGIGFAISSALLEKGSKVLLTDINVPALKDAYAKLKDKYGTQVKYADFSCDVTSIENIKEAFHICELEFGKPNLLINNAGNVIEKSLRSSLLLLLEAPINATEFAMEYMGIHNGGKGGNVVNVASISAIDIVAPFMPFYASAKAGLAVYTKNIGHPAHFEHTGVSVQCLCPGMVDTQLVRNGTPGLRRSFPELSELSAKIDKMINTGQFLKAEEIASVCIDLLEEGKSGAIMCKVHGRNSYYHEIM